jgi:hypothetical protein
VINNVQEKLYFAKVNAQLWHIGEQNKFQTRSLGKFELTIIHDLGHIYTAMCSFAFTDLQTIFVQDF